MSVIADLTNKAPELPWWAVAVLALVAYRLFNVITYYIAYKRSGASLAPAVSDGWYGFKLMKLIVEKQRNGEMPDYLYGRFLETGHDTVHFTMAGTPVVSTRDPENIKALLGTQFNDFILGLRHRQFQILLGDGIFTLDGLGWKHSRAMLRPQFAREQVGHVRALEPHVQSLAKLIREANGQEFDIQPLFFKLTIDSGTEFLFGESCESLREDEPGVADSGPAVKREFAKAFNISQSYLFMRAGFQKLYWIVNNPRFWRNNKIVHEFADYYVHKALNSSPEEVEKFSNSGYVFLYELAKQTRDPKVLRDQCLNILLAARDTTAGLLSFMFFELARNPQVFARLREEIVQNFGEGDDVDLSGITFESLKKLEYLKWVINETLRLYPSVPQNFRVATKDTSLPRGGGPDGNQPVFVRKGQTVTYTIFATHRLESVYGKDALSWRPERWGEVNMKKVGWGFLPFNGGPRICLGQQFALTEASYVTVRLLQMFKNIRSFDDCDIPKKASHLTMSLHEGAHISLA
ncbi:hypothetical protein FT663_00310 [Candidozyma haemuli var. vulneris]|uniref:Uncharacterized protein n=1 Tax=Candidozyma haemuli TaxID=45357 RepID=A0A2V1AR91_9ASCO|nr:hypothetical protein CXQ85_002039 [[Candida] haemuloni]KAF3993001.1 hypothetical protein FT662_00824 [[Candida] haemuloni var. vulneris]KAF3995563.1 hypothetical protein FT663_00310 [[Candida] haemuloni var. vulneris]PVH20254.1 hypothetical protein CXQ85_002039 [[Candida] haemuloni]